MATEWELIHFCLLPPQVKDADLGIRDTSTEARLWIRLVLTITVTAEGGKNPGLQGFTSELDNKHFECSIQVRPKEGWGKEGGGGKHINL